MNKKIKTIITLLLLSSTAFGQQKLSLNDCLNILFEKSIAYQNLLLEEKRDEVNRALSFAYKYPTVSLSVGLPISLSKNINEVYNSSLNEYKLIERNQESFNPLTKIKSNYTLPFGGTVDVGVSSYLTTSHSNLSADRKNFKYGLSASFNQPLFKVNSYRINEERAELQLKRAKLNFVKNKNDIISRTIEKFYHSCLAQKNFSLSKTRYNDELKKLEKEELRFEIGKISQADLLSHRVNIKTQKLNLLDSKRNYEKSLRELLLHLGLELSTPFYLNDSLEFYSAEIELDDALDLVLSGNAEYQVLKFSLATSELDYEIESATNIETNLSASTGLSHTNFYQPDERETSNYDYRIGLDVKIPIFDGGVSQSKEQLAEIVLAETKNNIKLKKQSLMLQVKEYYYSMNKLEEEYKITLEKLELLKSTVEVYENEYQNGRKTLLELNDKENLLLETERKIFSTVVEYNKKVLELKSFLGMELF